MENCHVSTHARVIAVDCTFTDIRAVGFQIIVQRNDPQRMNVLHVNTSMDPGTPAMIEVEHNGEYLVTILPIQNGIGMDLLKTFVVHLPSSQGMQN